jgi:hypothetical protein
VRALDLALEEPFAETMQRVFPGNPLEHLDAYCRFTESSFLIDVARWADSPDPDLRSLGEQWRAILERRVEWKMACERTLNFHAGSSERTTIFSEPELVEQRIRKKLSRGLRGIPLKVDVARHYHRPSGRLPAGGQNYVLDPAAGSPQELDDDELFRSLPISFSIIRVYSKDHTHDAELNAALNNVLGDIGDSKTNM